MPDSNSSPQALRLGGVFAMVGGLLYFLTLIFHGDLPDQTTEIALNHIAGRPEWPFLKLSLIVSIFLWVGAFLALASSLSKGHTRLLAQLAVACLLLGAAVVLVEYSVLGHELKQRADAFQMSSGPEREQQLLIAEALLGVTSGLFLSFISWLIGLPYLLMGLAISLERAYPRWLGWWAMAAAAGALFSGTTRFVGLEIVPFPVLYGGFIIPLNLWLAVAGVLMWRRGAVGKLSGVRSSA